MNCLLGCLSCIVSSSHIILLDFLQLKFDIFSYKFGQQKTQLTKHTVSDVCPSSLFFHQNVFILSQIDSNNTWCISEFLL